MSPEADIERIFSKIQRRERLSPQEIHLLRSSPATLDRYCRLIDRRIRSTDEAYPPLTIEDMRKHLFPHLSLTLVTQIFEGQIRSEQDKLTGLLNRWGLDKYFGEMHAKNLRRFTLIYLDIDDFKSINDTSGHESGDLVLSAVAEAIRKAVRRTTRDYKDLICRYGGDEFIIILPHTSRENAEKTVLYALRAFLRDGEKIPGVKNKAHAGTKIHIRVHENGRLVEKTFTPRLSYGICYETEGDIRRATAEANAMLHRNKEIKNKHKKTH